MKTVAVSASVIVLAALVTGCASPAEVRYKASNTPSYLLCEKLVQATLAPAEYRQIWATELQIRGETCAQYAGQIAASSATNAAALQSGIQLLQQARGAPAAPSMNVFGNLVRQKAIGTDRICVYDRGGQEVTLIQPQLRPCPASF